MTVQSASFNYLQDLWQTTLVRRISKGTNCARCSDLDEHAAIEDQLHQIASLLGYDMEELQQSRHVLGETPCQQCNLYLLLKVIDNTLPVEEIPHWMERANSALKGQTPLQAIQNGHYDEVIDTLFRVEATAALNGR